jgi:hypothetical protein
MSFGGRRIVPDTPRLSGRQWPEVTQELQEFLEALRDSGDEGLPAGYSDATPSEGAAGGSGDAGDEDSGWAAADHTHPHTVGTPVDIALANADGAAGTFADSAHVHASKLTTNGDLLTVIAGVLARLAAGSNEDMLVQKAGLPAWTTLLTTNGDILTMAAGILARLAVGANDKVLAVASGAPAWTALSGLPINVWSVLTPAQITSNQDDYDPGSEMIWRLSTDASRDITGILAGSNGQLRLVVNQGGNDIVLKHQDASSSAANRFYLKGFADVTLSTRSAIWIWYDGATARWRDIEL